MTEKTFLKIQAVWPLAAGALLYAVLSPDVWFVRELGNIFQGGFQPAAVPCGRLVRFIRNYVPDMLWGYALTSVLLLTVRQGAVHITDRTVLGISCLFSAVLELLQLFSWVSGTFDMADIAALWVSHAAAVIAAGAAAHRKGEDEDEKQGGEGSVCGTSGRVCGNGGRKRFFRK